MNVSSSFILNESIVKSVLNEQQIRKKILYSKLCFCIKYYFISNEMWWRELILFTLTSYYSAKNIES